MPKLLIIAKGKPREIEMGQELTIGRGYSNLLRLEGEEISRVHAIIYRRDSDFILRDLDSKNGVFLNGNKIACAELGPGDRVQVGKYRMVFNPPPDFDMDRFTAGSGSSNAASGNGSQHNGVDISDTDYSRSRLFSAAPAKDKTPIVPPPPPPVRREEVSLLLRPEIDGMLRDNSGVFASLNLQWANDFFESFTSDVSRNSEAGVTFIDALLTALTKVLPADRGVVITRDTVTGALHPAAIIPQNSDVAVNRVVLRSGFSEGKAILCPATSECGLFRDSTTVARENISTLISVPLCAPEPLAILYVDRQGDCEPFESRHFAAAIRVARLLEMHIQDISRSSVTER